jgi:hypothetical protein
VVRTSELDKYGDKCWRRIGVKKRSRQVLRTVPYIIEAAKDAAEGEVGEGTRAHLV